MIARARQTPATYADLEALPVNRVGEIVGGVLHATPRPALPHAAASSALGEELGPPFKRGKGGPGGWIILDEPELHFGDDVLVPDLAGWRRERMPVEPVADTPFLSIAPDWVCEVLSPSTARLDRVKKWRSYLRERVKWLWLIDPMGRTLEAYQLEGDQYQSAGTWEAGERARIVPFDALELELDLLWGVEPSSE